MEGRSFEKWYWSLYLLILLYKKLSKNLLSHRISRWEIVTTELVLCSGSHSTNIQIFARLCFHLEFESLFLNSRGLAKFSSLQLWNWLPIPLTAVIQVPLLAFRDIFLAMWPPPTSKSARENLPHVESLSCFESLFSGRG